ncbi:helix-turn-helix transcriptional regulator [Streptococcus suis]|uniref:helix-turn-helix domain-containing protein n=1 Tax=Streptococcus suis TaxID=1307 RepID=UPI001C96CE3E|nr:helix-turn-helix transcriptional regulator [Streptococcus suis]MBY4963171.1 helix-turn-helix transcriptional regulator [Streptococcus suis]MBY4969491.1 helix-turn-helix transcriptional regulator [Streptococcus suis]MBY4980581.1 helix-turn-helix transcriptional regulator [Streptococcus suis]MBY4989165.1 helix-turn-helix transcriptional regulator [Streptococcus suis]MBY4995746.1 helix-turn-helix transcriptional regulator [Streptococcus suis]
MEIKKRTRDYRVFIDGQEDLLNLEEWIAHRRMKKTHFARLVGVSPVTVSRWISGERSPAGYLIAQICDVLDCHPSEIKWHTREKTTTTTTTESAKTGNILTSWLSSVKELVQEVS